MSGIFPAIQPEAAQKSETLPPCMEIAWDFQEDRPIFTGGRPLVVTREKAVQVWCWNALKNPRGRYPIHSRDYGSELEELMGQAFTPELKQSEAVRYVRETLQINPYITGVEDIAVDFVGDRLSIHCAVSTIYGEVTVDV
ncbi:MAG: DUF2634 domain-containing protein [Oscillospiraceae bacterium]